ncbi:MAG: acyltransferase [Ruminococcus sp.]|uniref:acyltransferase family protein n=1 Tax=Ruminococcus sp. TaxID=41978 RepID=UPI0025CDA3F9|nr:acyltransferase [Ruminococcus sp.]MBR5682091.1 acyltransferase [Ruminococcus sp.]
MENDVIAKTGGKRDSNIELFRIIAMLLIVAHHYVINSGLMNYGGPIAADQMSGRSVFLLLFGAWGKTGINCFVMITGYFMCRSKITAKKFAKLLLEIMFYRIGIYIIFLMTGYERLSAMRLVQAVIPVTSVKQNFWGCFIVFFLSIPFLNALIQSLNERQHIRLLLLCFFTYVLFGTIHGGPFGVTMNYVSWFMVIYFIAAYIRLYPKELFSDRRKCGLILLLSLFVSIASILCCAFIGSKKGIFAPFYFVTDSNSFLPVVVGIFAFLFFKSIRIPYSKFINTVAASSFGVLLIHANCDAMRKWLWNDVLDNVGTYGKSYIFLHAIGSVIIIYAVCTVVDILRINLLEKPFFKWWDKHWDSFSAKMRNKEDKLFKKLHIG